MKLIMSLFLLGSVFFVQAYGQDEKTKKKMKIYTQKELDEAVRKEDENGFLINLSASTPIIL
jgi:hypothetical protein